MYHGSGQEKEHEINVLEQEPLIGGGGPEYSEGVWTHGKDEGKCT